MLLLRSARCASWNHSPNSRDPSQGLQSLEGAGQGGGRNVLPHRHPGTGFSPTHQQAVPSAATLTPLPLKHRKMLFFSTENFYSSFILRKQNKKFPSNTTWQRHRTGEAAMVSKQKFAFFPKI